MRYGDPQFIIYYEMFPPGEGVSWEFYSDFDYRVIAMLPPGYDGKKDLVVILVLSGKVQETRY